MLPALIAAGASLIGGKMIADSQDRANRANSPKKQVRSWEAAGINPIVGITQGQFIPQQAVSMGDAFASAGSQFANGMRAKQGETEQALRETQLELQNDVLRKQLDEASKPEVLTNMERFTGNRPAMGDTAVNPDIVPTSEVTGLPLRVNPITLTELGNGEVSKPYATGGDLDERLTGAWDQTVHFFGTTVPNAQNVARTSDLYGGTVYGLGTDGEMVKTPWPPEAGTKPADWDKWNEGRRTGYLRNNTTLYQ